MKILLLGSSGQLGEYLVKDLEILGELVKPSHMELDITNIIQLENFFQKYSYFDWVINTTAYNLVDLAEIHWQDAFSLNAVAVKNLSKFSASIGARFITFSTDYVFDGNKSGPYLEYDIPKPLQIYGASKLSGECLALAENEQTYVIRTAGLYGGTGSKQKGGNFVLNRLKESKESDMLKVSSNQTTSTTYAKDLSSSTVALISKKAPAGIYHLISEGSVSWAEFTKEIFDLVGVKCQIESINRDFSSESIKRPLNSILENKHAKNFGVTLPNWHDSLRSYLNELLLIS